MNEIKDFLRKNWFKTLLLMVLFLYVLIIGFEKISYQKIQAEKISHQIELDKQEKIAYFFKKCEEEFVDIDKGLKSGSAIATIAWQFFQDKYKSSNGSTVDDLLISCAKKQYNSFYND
jgi:hypothetical protein